MKFSEMMAYYDYKFTNIAKALSVSTETVRLWKKKGEIPYKMQCVLEVITKGELKADSK